jgi:hypothetical protein
MLVSIAVINVAATEPGRVWRQQVPQHTLNHTLADATPFLNRAYQRLRRALNAFDGNPDARALGQLDRRLRPKTAMLENRVHQFHRSTCIQYRAA